MKHWKALPICVLLAILSMGCQSTSATGGSLGRAEIFQVKGGLTAGAHDILIERMKTLFKTVGGREVVDTSLRWTGQASSRRLIVQVNMTGQSRDWLIVDPWQWTRSNLWSSTEGYQLECNFMPGPWPYTIRVEVYVSFKDSVGAHPHPDWFAETLARETLIYILKTLREEARHYGLTVVPTTGQMPSFTGKEMVKWKKGTEGGKPEK